MRSAVATPSAISRSPSSMEGSCSNLAESHKPPLAKGGFSATGRSRIGLRLVQFGNRKSSRNAVNWLLLRCESRGEQWWEGESGIYVDECQNTATFRRRVGECWSICCTDTHVLLAAARWVVGLHPRLLSSPLPWRHRLLRSPRPLHRARHHPRQRRSTYPRSPPL